MTHMIEDTVARLRDRIVKGSVLVRRYWPDHGTPHHATDFQRAEGVSFDKDGWLTVTYMRYEEGKRNPVRRTALYPPDEMIALAVDGSGSRTILPGGYLDAVPGGNWKVWDVFRTDGTPLAQGVGMLRARDLLDGYAPEMIWVHHGDGNWTAKGSGYLWKIARSSRNPDYDVHSPIWQCWLYSLSRCPLGTDEWETVTADGKVPGELRKDAPASQSS
jgi:hypothetical protein